MDWDKLFKDRQARIGVIGLGYVGLPLAMEFCRRGFSVTGVDIDPKRVDSLNHGRSYVLDIASEEIKKFTQKKLFYATQSFDDIGRCHALLVSVPTPLRKTKDPDLSYVVAAADAISKKLKKGQLVVLESTVFPGATEELFLPALEKGGRKVGRDFYLAFSPERVDPGNVRYNIANTPKVVGANDAVSLKAAVALYGSIVSQVVPVSSIKAAEMVKLLENSFRLVNIALANEVAQASHQLGLDTWEILKAASTKPFGFMPFYPGPGIGGHCIPKDPQLLAWKMKSLNYETRLISAASQINSAMPRYTGERISAVLNEKGRSLKGSRLFVIGVAYKPDTTDYRESPALDVIDYLWETGAKISYHDPFVPEIKFREKSIKSVPLTDSALKTADAVLILTAHKEIDYERIVKKSGLVFDARNATAGIKNSHLYKL